MISEEAALAQILKTISPLPKASVQLGDALDRFAAMDINAGMALPPFDNSAMDGYAVVAASAKKGARLKIVGEQSAGVSRQLRVSAGETVRIFTGATIPNGADAVVMQEETDRDGNFVLIRSEKIVAGDFVRKAGGDVAVGQKVLQHGQRIRAVTLALLASQGMASVEVHASPRVAIISTGDEIVSPGASLQAGQIFESNGLMLSALSKKTGAKVMETSHCPDDYETLCAALRRATEFDGLIISGGVSVGEHDLVQKALREIGATIDLWRVSIKPGKPFLFGTRRSCAIFGLPGNPVSSFVTFTVFVRPALLRMMGADSSEAGLTQASARLDGELIGDATRPHYFRGQLSGDVFKVVGRQESHAVFGLARANGLVRVRPGEIFRAGTSVEVLLI